jgi:lipopolysaccharide export system permease protein
MLSLKGVGNTLEHSTNTFRGDREMTIAMLKHNYDAKRGELDRVVDSARVEMSRALQKTLAGAGVPGGPRPVLLPPTVGLGPDRLDFRWRTGDELVRQTALLMRSSADQAGMFEDQANSFLVEYYKKFSIPFASIVFVLIGAPLALRFPRGGTGTVIAISLAIFSIYYVGLIGGETLSDKNLLSPFLAMWGANIVFLLLSVYGVATIGHERSTVRADSWADVFYAGRQAALRSLRRLGRSRRAGGEGTER